MSEPSSNTAKPSDFGNATVVHDAPQQAATMPEPGADEEQQEPVGQQSWKEKVVANAKITRGTLLNKPEQKELGHQILRGETTVLKSSQPDN
ncbi:hypothetical protein SISNIDRAFT_485842 [Sistotremastrum niveocremeum HHB9708]|uniref:Uncharacterized protein n=1 Tax=Sistotremastrum niveocremeum HHB9708 TaxID=1314777 RepID=A0A164U3N7_9AGAM|nr:hypothetical protein SISNIDRAFT_485842 [Sistotremastrum niveocremeum HHB9708]